MIGIDLGTTNSLVSVLDDGNPVVLENELGEKLTPSAVAVAEDGEILVGRAAKDRVIVDSASGVLQFKRDMGLAKSYAFGDRDDWTPVECSALVLREMKRIAELHLKKPVSSAVITVPAYFHDQQRQATLEAAQIAGLKVERLINEPTAAALAFGYRASQEEESSVLVFDIGGGTFDVTLLEVFDGIIEVKASGGVSRLGGEDYTANFAEWLRKQHGPEIEERHSERWLALVEVLKRRLCRQEKTSIQLDGKEIPLTRADFEAATAELSARIRPVVRRCFRDAGIDPESVDDVLMVGGASRMPGMIRLISEEVGRVPNQKIEKDYVVALGAAVQAALCDEHESIEDIVLTDVCPHTLGINITREAPRGRFLDGYFAPIIDRNVTVPVSRSDVFTTFRPESDAIDLEVYQGEGRMVADNQLIGNVHVRGLRHRPGQKHPGLVEVRFTYDMNGILEVEATLLHSGEKIRQVFEQRPGTLSPKEIEAAIARLAPLKIHPRDTLPNRARLERANRLFEDLVGPTRNQLQSLVEDFELALETQEHEPIAVTTTRLDQFTRHFYAEEVELPS